MTTVCKLTRLTLPDRGYIDTLLKLRPTEILKRKAPKLNVFNMLVSANAPGCKLAASLL